MTYGINSMHNPAFSRCGRTINYVDKVFAVIPWMLTCCGLETTCYKIIVILSVLFDLPYLSLINICVCVYVCPFIASTPSH